MESAGNTGLQVPSLWGSCTAWSHSCQVQELEGREQSQDAGGKTGTAGIKPPEAKTCTWPVPAGGTGTLQTGKRRRENIKTDNWN